MTQNVTTPLNHQYDDDSVRLFINATLFWGVVAMLLGVVLAFQLADWQFNFGISWLTFGRLRPIHTNAAIFAFCGNAIFAGVYYSTQRLLKARLFNDLLTKLHFWGWQLIIVCGALSLFLGFSHGKEYAELEWPFDIAIAVVWVIFAINFFGTIWKRREHHIYVALWFYIATILTVALLHIVNSLEFPVSFMKSYPIYAGIQDALVQWWYGHNAVAFFLTTPFLGLMYYFIPKAANRPVYSYRLSIIHFWSLVFIYIWAGPHHLLYSALPEWLQTAGMAFSIMLWAPSWGGMINGLLTLRGAWDRVRQDPMLKFFATAVTIYGMATFEGPLMSIKSINNISHFTDWTIGHVHGGTIGWNYFLIAGIFLYLVPKLYNTTLYSRPLANAQFWLGTLGLLMYYLSMLAAGITQGSMWRAIDSTGKLVYPNFVETVVRIIPLYWVRAVGGTFVLISLIMLIYNLIKTMKQGKTSVALIPIPTSAQMSAENHGKDQEKGHRKLEGMPLVFSVLSVLAVLVGTLLEIIPTLLAHHSLTKLTPKIRPYTPLELVGRDIYIREGCYTCHSQLIRPDVADELRYGKVSEAEEYLYDRPFQWGSRRIGPDLTRVGGKYNHMWHYRHMLNPRDVTPNSIMPIYPWLMERSFDVDQLTKKMKVMQALGSPYSQSEIENAVQLARKEAQQITEVLSQEGDLKKSVDQLKDKEIIALISYLQGLGAKAINPADDVSEALKAEANEEVNAEELKEDEEVKVEENP
jgi:cytochrome c oxidase cbb3-type subunit I/II